MKHILSSILIICIAASYSCSAMEERSAKRHRVAGPEFTATPSQEMSNIFYCGICETSTNQEQDTQWFPTTGSNTVHGKCFKKIEPLYKAKLDGILTKHNITVNEQRVVHIVLMGTMKDKCNMPIGRYFDIYGSVQLQKWFNDLVQ